MIFLTAGIVSFIYIFLKASQQIHVVNGQYMWVVPTSVGMGLCEVGTVLLVIKADNLLLGVVTGVCAGLGAMLAMRIHHGKKA